MKHHPTRQLKLAYSGWYGDEDGMLTACHQIWWQSKEVGSESERDRERQRERERERERESAKMLKK